LTRPTRPAPIWILAACLAASAIGSLHAEELDPRAVLNEAKAKALTIPGQASALVRLAWPAEAPLDPLVRAAARQELLDFNTHAFPALRAAVKQVAPRYRADVIATLIEARHREPAGSPPDYLPGLEEAIWFGSIEARRLAMIEISRYSFPPAVPTIIDAIHLDPELTRTGIRTLGRMRDERARFYLRHALSQGEPRFKSLAARALGLLGDAGIAVLRERATANDRPVREAAILAFLPYTTPDDATRLHEYAIGFADDSPQLLEQVRNRALELEILLEEELLLDAEGAEE